MVVAMAFNTVLWLLTDFLPDLLDDLLQGLTSIFSLLVLVAQTVMDFFGGAVELTTTVVLMTRRIVEFAVSSFSLFFSSVFSATTVAWSWMAEFVSAIFSGLTAGYSAARETLSLLLPSLAVAMETISGGAILLARGGQTVFYVTADCSVFFFSFCFSLASITFKTLFFLTLTILNTFLFLISTILKTLSFLTSTFFKALSFLTSVALQIVSRITSALWSSGEEKQTTQYDTSSFVPSPPPPPPPPPSVNWWSFLRAVLDVTILFTLAFLLTLMISRRGLLTRGWRMARNCVQQLWLRGAGVRGGGGGHQLGLDPAEVVNRGAPVEISNVRRRGNPPAGSSGTGGSQQDASHQQTPRDIPDGPQREGFPPSSHALGLEGREEEEDQSRLCIVCMDQEKKVLLRPCCHYCVCEDCSKRLRGVCPVCREVIQRTEVIHIFYD